MRRCHTKLFIILLFFAIFCRANCMDKEKKHTKSQSPPNKNKNLLKVKGAKINKSKGKEKVVDERPPAEATEEAAAADDVPTFNAKTTTMVMEIEAKIDQFIKDFGRKSNQNKLILPNIGKQFENEQAMKRQQISNLPPIQQQKLMNIFNQNYVMKSKNIFLFIHIMDTVHFGIGTLMFLLQVPGQNDMENWAQQVKWVACKLLYVGPIYGLFMRYIELITKRLVARSDQNKALANNSIIYIKNFVPNFESDHGQELANPLSGLKIFLHFFEQLDKLCTLFYDHQFLNSFDQFKKSLQSVRTFLNNAIGQFKQFVHIGQSVDIDEQIKAQLCQF